MKLFIDQLPFVGIELNSKAGPSWANFLGLVLFYEAIATSIMNVSVLATF